MITDLDSSGEQTSVSTENPLFTTISIPSSTLKVNNLEVFIGPVESAKMTPENVKDTSIALESLLSPSLETTIPNSSQYTMLQHPVHKAVVLGQGVRDCLAMGGLASLWSREKIIRRLIKIVVGLHARSGVPEPNQQGPVAVVDVELASSALNKFRKSLQHATVYEHEWFRSGLPELAAWLTEGLKGSAGNLKPVVGQLVISILDDADRKITEEELAKQELIARATVPETTRQELLAALRAWAEEAHTELRDGLELAFQSKEWRRLKWWKLLWRVDDVASITSAILQQRWLVEAEKGIVWLAGCAKGVESFKRLQMPRLRQRRDEARKERPSRLSRLWGAPPAPRVPLQSEDGALSITPPAPALWPTDIAMARYQLYVASIPALQALGQRLVIRSLLTTGLSSALSGLLYVSYTGTMYEVGVVAAIGLVWSMRILQTRWEAARAIWQAELHEEGRRILRDMEITATAAFRDAGRPTEDVGDVEARRLARESVESARKALLAVHWDTRTSQFSDGSGRSSAAG